MSTDFISTTSRNGCLVNRCKTLKRTSIPNSQSTIIIILTYIHRNISKRWWPFDISRHYLYISNVETDTRFRYDSPPPPPPPNPCGKLRWQVRLQSHSQRRRYSWPADWCIYWWRIFIMSKRSLKMLSSLFCPQYTTKHYNLQLLYLKRET